MIWATVRSWSCFCWLYRASPSLAAKNIHSLVLYFQVPNTQLCFQFLIASGKHRFNSITPAGNQIVSSAPGLCHDHLNVCHSSSTCSSSSILDTVRFARFRLFWNTVRFVLLYVSAWACEIQEIVGEGIIFGENTRRNACIISKNSRFKHPVSPVFERGHSTWRKTNSQRFVRKNEPFLLRKRGYPSFRMLGSLTQS